MSLPVHADVPEFEVNIDVDGRVSFAHAPQARAYLRGKFKGQCIVAQFYEHRTKRSGAQNRALHALASAWGRERGWRIEDLKQFLLAKVFGWLEFIDPLTGEVYKVLAEPHTSTLKMGQFCELVEATLELAAEDGVVLLAPDEFKRQKAALSRREARAKHKDAA